MKKTLLGILTTLSLVLALPCFTSCSDSKEQKNTTVVTEDGSEIKLPVAVVDMAEVLTMYDFAIELREELMNTMESSQATLNQQQRALEADAKEFQRKIENNAFFNEGRAQSEYERIMRKEQELQVSAMNMQQKLAAEEEEMNIKLAENIEEMIQRFNDEVGGYQIIFARQGLNNVLYASEAYDVTEEFVKFLNKQYAKGGTQPEVQPEPEVEAESAE